MGNTTLKLNTWVKDDENKRTNLYFTKQPTLELDINTIKSVDLRNCAPPIYGTGYPEPKQLTNENVDLMFATPNAVTSVCEYLNIKNGKSIESYSRMFLYFNSKDNRGVISKDIPVSFIDCLETIKVFGMCPDELWPYNTEKSNLIPIKHCYEEAKKYKIYSFYKINQQADTIKKCIANGEPILFGLNIYQNFLNIAPNTILDVPKDWEQQIGEYATACYGYDDSKRAFLCRGSFGNMWADSGYFWVSYDYVLSNKCTDFWTISLI